MQIRCSDRYCRAVNRARVLSFLGKQFLTEKKIHFSEKRRSEIYHVLIKRAVFSSWWRIFRTLEIINYRASQQQIRRSDRRLLEQSQMLRVLHHKRKRDGGGVRHIGRRENTVDRDLPVSRQSDSDQLSRRGRVPRCREQQRQRLPVGMHARLRELYEGGQSRFQQRKKQKTKRQVFLQFSFSL